MPQTKPVIDDGKISATVFRMTTSELKVVLTTLSIRFTPTDSKETLRDKLLKSAGFKDATTARAQSKPSDLSPDEKYTYTRQAIADEIALLQATLDTLRSLSNMNSPSPEWLANQAQHEIRYAHGKTNIARLVSMTKTEGAF